MEMIKDDSVVVLIGKRNTGKSFLTNTFLETIVNNLNIIAYK
jgi:polynucleotide 5'-kinase involved in rRNA processing